MPQNVPTLEKISSNKVFQGDLIKYKFKVHLPPLVSPTSNHEHIQSDALGGLYAQFNLFLPRVSNEERVPILVYLAGLTCSEDNG